MGIHAIVLAAGIGSRVGSVTPKQYIHVLNKPIIFYSLKTLSKQKEIKKISVALSKDDLYWDRLAKPWLENDDINILRCGGKTRSESALNALNIIKKDCHEKDWILIHDAARPCVSQDAINELIKESKSEKVGLVLGYPISDSLKKVDGKTIIADQSRDYLWAVQTPQAFPYPVLDRALNQFHGFNDESSAVMAMGLKPKVILSDSENIKVTYHKDIKLAELIIQSQGY